jgi:hypothetical protein
MQTLTAGQTRPTTIQGAGKDEPIPFNRVGDAGSIGFDRAQVVEGLPSLRLTVSRHAPNAGPAALASASHVIGTRSGAGLSHVLGEHGVR